MTLLLPKSPPLRLPSHLARVREMPCLACNRPGPSEAHHLKLGWFRKGEDPPDNWTIPLCHECHIEKLHRHGERTFWLLHLERDKTLLAAVMRSFAHSLYQDEMVSR